MFLHPSVIPSVHMGEGVCIQEGRGWEDPPPPEIQKILRNTVNKGAVCIILECFFVFIYFFKKFWRTCLSVHFVITTDGQTNTHFFYVYYFHR